MVVPGFQARSRSKRVLVALDRDKDGVACESA
jgi:Excalibur calcium-binding domain